MEKEEKNWKVGPMDELTGKKKEFKEDMDAISSIMNKWDMQGLFMMMGDVGAIVDFRGDGGLESNIKLKRLIDGVAGMAKAAKEDAELSHSMSNIRPFIEKLALAVFDPCTPSAFVDKLADDVRKKIEERDPSESWKHSFEKYKQKTINDMKIWPKGITDLADEYNHKFLKGNVDGMEPSHMDFFITVANKVKTHDEIDYMDFIKLFEQIKPKLEM